MKIKWWGGGSNSEIIADAGRPAARCRDGEPRTRCAPRRVRDIRLPDRARSSVQRSPITRTRLLYTIALVARALTEHISELLDEVRHQMNQPAQQACTKQAFAAGNVWPHGDSHAGRQAPQRSVRARARHRTTTRCERGTVLLLPPGEHLPVNKNAVHECRERCGERWCSKDPLVRHTRDCWRQATGRPTLIRDGEGGGVA